jgi:hypothetical protein
LWIEAKARILPDVIWVDFFIAFQDMQKNGLKAQNPVVKSVLKIITVLDNAFREN